MSKTSKKEIVRKKRQVRVRKKVRGTSERPRLSVFRSARHMYVQLIDDTKGVTLAASSTLNLKDEYTGNIKSAEKIGQDIAEKAKNLGLKSVVFDRNGFLYHGRVKALADSARESGLVF